MKTILAADALTRLRENILGRDADLDICRLCSLNPNLFEDRKELLAKLADIKKLRAQILDKCTLIFMEIK